MRKTSAVFSYEDFRQVIDTLEYVGHVQNFFQSKSNRDAYPSLTHVAGSRIYVDPALLQSLGAAFDVATGQLSAKAFPRLGQLRSSIASLKATIRSTLTRITSTLPPTSLPSDGVASVNTVNGRFTISVNPGSMRSVGILHSRSRTLKTVYVEPFEVIEPSNELIELREDLEREERRILRRLTKDVVDCFGDFSNSLQACGVLDAIRGKVLHGEELQCCIPTVQDAGVINVIEGRHPTIPKCVANSVTLGYGGNEGLIITGPNAGGKTVIIKMLAVYALMVRDGLPLPSREGTRVDLFERVMADIGDGQMLGEMSTFQAHVKTMKDVLEGAEGGSSLVVLDEIGGGTSPEQGVALGRAVVEEVSLCFTPVVTLPHQLRQCLIACSSFWPHAQQLVARGSRVAVTTHFTEMKDLAAGDGRFSVAGMQFLSGLPTYKLEMGAVGESFALAVAERMGLPGSVLERAGELMSEEARVMSDLVRAMEEDRDGIRRDREAMEGRLREAEEMRKEVRRRRSQGKRSVIASVLERKVRNVSPHPPNSSRRQLGEKERQLEATKRVVRQQVRSKEKGCIWR